MRIEDEIKQKSFTNEYHKLNVNLIYTYNWMLGHMQQWFKSYGITSQQFNILRILRGQFPKPCTIQLLKERMLDKQSDVSRLVDRLTKKGLVERKVCEDDRRKMDVLISEEGLELLSKMDDKMSVVEDIFSNLTLEEAETLSNLLDKIRG